MKLKGRNPNKESIRKECNPLGDSDHLLQYFCINRRWSLSKLFDSTLPGQLYLNTFSKIDCIFIAHIYPSSPEPDAEAEEEDDDGGGEDGVGDAADAGQDLDAEQVEPAAVEQPVIHGVALQMVVL